MEVIEIKTLIDITDTGVRRPSQGTQQQIEQFKNWITLKQCVELRSVVEYDCPPSVEVVDIKGLGFGRVFKGQHAVWTWQFSPDREMIYADDNDALGGLVGDIDQVPIIQKLTETINIDKPVFELTDVNLRNTIVRIITK
jgi:hypothetical protein